MTDQPKGAPPDPSTDASKRPTPQEGWINEIPPTNPDHLDPEIATAIERYGDRLESVWQRAVVTLGLTTISAVYRRAVILTARKHPSFAILKVGEEGLDRGQLTRLYLAHAQHDMSNVQFSDALSDLTKWVASLLAEMISAEAATHLF